LVQPAPDRGVVSYFPAIRVFFLIGMGRKLYLPRDDHVVRAPCNDVIEESSVVRLDPSPRITIRVLEHFDEQIQGYDVLIIVSSATNTWGRIL